MVFAVPQAHAEKTYPTMDEMTLRKKADQGDILAMYWLGKNADVFVEKAKWYEKFASARKVSLSTSYIAHLYDHHENYERFADSKRSYYWYYITDILCKREEYEDKWCAKAKKRMPELAQEIDKDMLPKIKRAAKKWLRD